MRSAKWRQAGCRGLYLRDEEQSQRHGDGQVGVGEKQQQHPVRVKLANQGESVSAQS